MFCRISKYRLQIWKRSAQRLRTPLFFKSRRNLLSTTNARIGLSVEIQKFKSCIVNCTCASMIAWPSCPETRDHVSIRGAAVGGTPALHDGQRRSGYYRRLFILGVWWSGPRGEGCVRSLKDRGEQGSKIRCWRRNDGRNRVTIVRQWPSDGDLGVEMIWKFWNSRP